MVNVYGRLRISRRRSPTPDPVAMYKSSANRSISIDPAVACNWSSTRTATAVARVVSCRFSSLSYGANSTMWSIGRSGRKWRSLSRALGTQLDRSLCTCGRITTSSATAGRRQWLISVRVSLSSWSCRICSVTRAMCTVDRWSWCFLPRRRSSWKWRRRLNDSMFCWNFVLSVFYFVLMIALIWILFRTFPRWWLADLYLGIGDSCIA